MKNLLVVSICICCFLPLASATIISHQKNTQYLSQSSVLDGGWVEERDNITILHVSGSHYEMGFQHGYLLQEEVQQNIRAFLHYAEMYLPISDLLGYWNISKSYVPPRTSKRCKGSQMGRISRFMTSSHPSWQSNILIMGVMGLQPGDLRP